MKWFQRNKKFLKEPTQKDKLDPLDVDSDDEGDSENDGTDVHNEDLAE
jgi:hypothetical protein